MPARAPTYFRATAHESLSVHGVPPLGADADTSGKAGVTCMLTATGRRLRAKGTLVVTVTTVFAAMGGTRLQATSAVVLPRRG